VAADSIEQALGGLPGAAAAAFAASCCERMLPHYAAFAREVGWGAPALLRAALDRAWEHLLGRRLEPAEAEALFRRIESVAPDTDEFASDWTSPALDAACAVAAAIGSCLADAAARAVETHQWAVDTVDMYVQGSLEVGTSDRRVDELVLRDPRMQRELAKQAADVEALRSAAVLDAAFLTRFRAAAAPHGLGSLGIPAGGE
jgi:uncharacterized protein YjaG (DUF416 family)